jgi:hypothetical protein
MLGGGSPESSRAAGRAAVLGATIAVAGLAAWLSYWHIVDLASMAGEDQWSHLLPLTVDLPAVVAAVRRSQLDRLIREAESRHRPTTSRSAPTSGRKEEPASRPNRSTTGRRGPRGHGPRVLAARADHPEWTPAQIAEHVGCSVDTARKHLRAGPTRPAAPAAPATSNGNLPEPIGELDSSDRTEPDGSDGPIGGESPLSDTRGFRSDKGTLVGVSTNSHTTTEALP